MRRPLNERPNNKRNFDEAFILYLKQRRRALITELREIEKLLELKQSIPQGVRVR